MEHEGAAFYGLEVLVFGCFLKDEGDGVFELYFCNLVFGVVPWDFIDTWITCFGVCLDCCTGVRSPAYGVSHCRIGRCRKSERK